MPDVPLRVSFRRQVRETALEAASALLLDREWAQVRMGEVAAATGVSRPTLYNEFGSKQGLGEALVLRETERFLRGVVEHLQQAGDDAPAAVAAAVRYTLLEAERSPLLRATLTASRSGGDDSLLPMLTTRSKPVLDAASRVLSSWLRERFPELPVSDVDEVVDALVRLTVSHLVLPAGDVDHTAQLLARVAARYLQVPAA